MLFIMPFMNRSNYGTASLTEESQSPVTQNSSAVYTSRARSCRYGFSCLFLFLTYIYMFASCIGEQRYSQLGGWDGRRRPGDSRGRRHEGRGGRRQPEQDAGDLTRPTPRIASPPTTTTTTTCYYYRPPMNMLTGGMSKRMKPPME